jgi:hypothetical protein
LTLFNSKLYINDSLLGLKPSFFFTKDLLRSDLKSFTNIINQYHDDLLKVTSMLKSRSQRADVFSIANYLRSKQLLDYIYSYYKDKYSDYNSLGMPLAYQFKMAKLTYTYSELVNYLLSSYIDEVRKPFESLPFPETCSVEFPDLMEDKIYKKYVSDPREKQYEDVKFDKAILID